MTATVTRFTDREKMMGRRGYSTTVGKFAKTHHDRRVSEIRMLGEMLRDEQFHPNDRRRTMNSIAQSPIDTGATIRTGTLPRRTGSALPSAVAGAGR
jgi:hypothetical protein